MATTLPPYTAVVRSFADSRSDGTNTKLLSPVRAAAAATALARLPVDAHAAVLKPNSSAFATATATTRSLNEFVGLRVYGQAAVLRPNSSAFATATATTGSLNELGGLRVSSLSQRSRRPSSAPSRSARIRGVQPAESAPPAGASTGSNGA